MEHNDKLFLDNITKYPAESSFRSIYADWLEEQGRLAEAASQRMAAEAVDQVVTAERTRTLYPDRLTACCGRLTVESSPLLPGQTTITLDGHNVRCRSLVLSFLPDALPTATLVLHPTALAIGPIPTPPLNPGADISHLLPPPDTIPDHLSEPDSPPMSPPLFSHLADVTNLSDPPGSQVELPVWQEQQLSLANPRSWADPQQSQYPGSQALPDSDTASDSPVE